MRGFSLNPSQGILLSYLFLIAFGTLLLHLPVSTRGEVSLVDAFFTATSAVTVTGLVVLDTGADFTFFGELIILLLIQIGGLGYMTLATFFLITLGRKIGFKDRLILSEALNYPGLHGLVRFLRRVIVFVFALEFIGFLLLFAHWYKEFPIGEALWLSVFHSVSAFNNAGFSLFSDNLMGFTSDIYINLVISLLVVLGGLGFFVLNEFILFIRGEVKRLSTHTKLVLSVSGILMFAGWMGLLLTEAFHYSGLWSMELRDRLLSTLFLSVSSRTAGFNTVDISILSESSLFLLTLLMFIGASPGGTGGGIKTTTFSVVVLAVLSYIKGKEEVVVFRRRVADSQIHRAMVILSLSVLYIALINLLIDRFEERSFLPTLFEVISAFSTVGLSVGGSGGLSFSGEFSDIGKILIAITMIVGRVGILSFAIALVGRSQKSSLKHVEGKILI